MKKIILLVYLLFTAVAFAQSEQLAQNYFDKGDFEKALLSYQELLKTQPTHPYYFQKMIESYQQLERYDEAQKELTQKLSTQNQAGYLVDLGYNYQLKKDAAKAESFYKQALDRVTANPQEVYGVAMAFERHVLVKQALEAYTIATTADPKKFNFNQQMANLYGQLGNIDMMITTFLDESYANPNSLIIIQNQLSRFMAEDGAATFNDSLRKALLLRTQKSQDIFWNQFLSWFFVQQKEYGKAFIQEKAIYKRNPETFFNIINLAQLSIEEGNKETAKEILSFVLENTTEQDLLVQAHFYLAEMRVEDPLEKDPQAVNKYLTDLLTEFGSSPYTLSLQTLQAHFLAFKMNMRTEAKEILKTALTLPLSKFQAAEVKMELADILLLEEKFNQALIYYSQIEEDLKNDVIGHEASLQSAKTSYYKADFDWAQKQFKELKTASSQLIANDALEYFLLLNDNKAEDSLQVALKKFARADYLVYQNKNDLALQAFKTILAEHKGEQIESVTLLRIGRIYERQGDFTTALQYYDNIIKNFGESIYIDEALFFSAEIYNTKLPDTTKAKALYENIIFNHQDSIHFIEARKRFRELRGDTAS